MDRSEGERRPAERAADQPETEGSRASRSRRSVTRPSAERAGAGRQRTAQTKKQSRRRREVFFAER